MKRIIEVDPWKVVETSLHPEENRLAESLMSIGNGHMGMRGNFEETYTGETHEGTYIGGVYYPDKTRVGWWKNGYPEYFAKVLNAPNVTGIRVVVQNEELDLNTWNVMEFKRELDMRHGLLRRSFTAENGNGEHVQVNVTRFFSIAHPELVAIRYEVTPINFSGTISFQPFLNGDVRNEDANYDEDFWEPVHHEVSEQAGVLTMKTRKTEFEVSAAMRTAVEGADVTIQAMDDQEEYIDNVMDVAVTEGQPVTFYKYVAVTQSRDYDSAELADKAQGFVTEAFEKGFDQLLQEHQGAWEKRWKKADVTVGGDAEAQQGIRYNIFQLYNTYTGDDPRLNIGPKGFTGEKYGGSTYWDTEAYCLPFFLGTADPAIARNLLIYRYNHLDQARANARKLGLEGALYPMVTMNGEESHNEWEITFEEIHRNGAIAHAIWNYTNYTGDTAYLADYGFEVLAELSRFWASRVNYNPRKDRYMILGVTGPNEYENNVNNNWYTNRIAAWTLEYTLGVALFIERQHGARYYELLDRLGLSSSEFDQWKDIISKMYYPYDEDAGVFLQQDGFLDKEIMPVADLDEKHLPLNQNWSWDRILRSCFIKQADVLQGLYFLNHKFSKEEKKRNYNFYEPMTVHESSLSPCVHSILAAELGYEEKAYEMYVRTARLDLDNYNNDTEDGLHITSMAGSWLSIVHGFAGMRVVDGILHFNPMIPEEWKDYSFKINFRGHLLKITVNHDETLIEQEEGTPLQLVLNEETRTIEAPKVATP
ncbi:glycoside hydrolase family 65 protein [Pontibacillus sp. ALD_SL1]|uniref:glycoside hydrolase family 65 protein n=1 Tax=Pontibacillus sp. ALD_SL1 TaxID=2777185 RepID=UPI001A9715F5|nr:glycoside hydrolase family 65 protein [Pontibacillus sp. ALD_SL1]QST00784.1 glycoside hydrolase family 65 protein [Pontibacillus sp. ALD_SL1]